MENFGETTIFKREIPIVVNPVDILLIEFYSFDAAMLNGSMGKMEAAANQTELRLKGPAAHLQKSFLIHFCVVVEKKNEVCMVAVNRVFDGEIIEAGVVERLFNSHHLAA